MSDNKKLSKVELEKVNGGEWFNDVWNKAKEPIKNLVINTNDNKELKNEDLEKVTGGESLGEFKLSFVKIYYKENNVPKDKVVGFKYDTLDRTFEEDENDAQLWCQINGYEYVSCEKTAPPANDSIKFWGIADY